jgi:hypothetical protein
MENDEVSLYINKDPQFTEVWYEGRIEHQGKEHKFWLVHPQGKDPDGNEYEVEVRWFFQRVPMEIRGLQFNIIEAFKSTQNYGKDGSNV